MKLQEAAEEAWDKYSQHIDDSLFSLEQIAGTSVITRTDFIKAVQLAVATSVEVNYNFSVADLKATIDFGIQKIKNQDLTPEALHYWQKVVVKADKEFHLKIHKQFP